MKKENGFSLLEVSVAVAIMSILTGIGFTIASSVNEGNGSKSQEYQTSEQTNLDYADCAAKRVADPSMHCTSVKDLYANAGNNSAGVTAIWNGAELTYSINSQICSQTSPAVSYYYNDAFNGSVLMTSTSGSSFYPIAAGYPLGHNLGYGNSITSYYVVATCNGISTRSDNDVS